MSRSRGRGISRLHRGGTSLVARNSSCFLSRIAPLGGGGSPSEPVKAGSVNGASPSGLRPVPIRAITLRIPPYDSDGHRESNRAVLVFQLELIRVECSPGASNATRISQSCISIFPRVTSGETLPPDAAAGHNDPATGLSADGTFHLLSVRGPLTKQFPRT
jgi:hypothetical protein